MNSHDKKTLRAKAHHLKPVVLIGQAGISEQVLSEINLALDHHELIKIRIRVMDRDVRRHAAEAICGKTHAELVQRIGQIVVIYRENIAKNDVKSVRKSA